MIYFLNEEKDTSKVKIGFSKNSRTLRGRISQLQIGNPKKLEVLGVMDGNKHDEHRLHKILSEYRLESEWFLMSEPLKQYIKAKTKSWNQDLVFARETVKMWN